MFLGYVLPDCAHSNIFLGDGNTPLTPAMMTPDGDFTFFTGMNALVYSLVYVGNNMVFFTTSWQNGVYKVDVSDMTNSETPVVTGLASYTKSIAADVDAQLLFVSITSNSIKSFRFNGSYVATVAEGGIGSVHGLVADPVKQ